MRVQLIGHEHPDCLWIAGDRLGNMRRKIGFGAPRPDRGGEYLPTHDIKVDDRRERAMPFILKLVAPRPTRSHGLGRCNPFQGLHPGDLIGADDMATQRMQQGRIGIECTDQLDLGGKQQRVTLLRIEPIATLMRFEIGLILKSARSSGVKYWRQSLV